MAFLVNPPMVAPFFRTEGSLSFCGRHLNGIVCDDACSSRLMEAATNDSSRNRRRRNLLVPLAKATTPVDPSHAEKSYMKIVKMARQSFTKAISFANKDSDISLAKALLFIAAEDEAFLSLNRAIDAFSFSKELEDYVPSDEMKFECTNLEDMLMAEKNISGWLDELDLIAQEVEAELVSRDIGCHLVQVVEAINVVLFESREFKRFPVLVDPQFSYLHHALNSGSGSAIIFSIIYMEVCRRLGIKMVGARVGEDFLIWPHIYSLEELFRTSSGHSLFAVINGKCVEDPRSKAYDLDSKSLLGLESVTNRDIIGIALANLIRLHWKRASRTNHGLMLSSPLRPVHNPMDKSRYTIGSSPPLLRPQELRLAAMASERLLILQPHNWSLRRDYGLLLYHSRNYVEAVQELGISMAFAPAEEAEVLEPLVEKLHLLRLESSWKLSGNSSR